MGRYLLRRNFTAVFSDERKTVHAKIAFKTQETQWLNTQLPVIALVSVHSAFHEGMEGDLKMNAWMSTIKENVKGRVTVLLSDKAHLHAASLKYENDLQITFEECKRGAQDLSKRYRRYFDNARVAFWHSYICQDKIYDASLKLVKELYNADSLFPGHLQQDAQACYTDQRMQDFSDKGLFIEKTIEDILGQCASMLVLINKGYRFVFYPGSPYASTEYVNQVLVPDDKKMCWIDTFLSIEKKSFLNISA